VRANHVEICKFSGRDVELYETAVNQIRKAMSWPVATDEVIPNEACQHKAAYILRRESLYHRLDVSFTTTTSIAGI
jgi:hypothetical protein